MYEPIILAVWWRPIYLQGN